MWNIHGPLCPSVYREDPKAPWQSDKQRFDEREKQINSQQAFPPVLVRLFLQEAGASLCGRASGMDLQ